MEFGWGLGGAFKVSPMINGKKTTLETTIPRWINLKTHQLIAIPFVSNESVQQSCKTVKGVNTVV